MTTATTSGIMIVEAMASATALVIAGTITMTMIGHVNEAAATTVTKVTSGVTDTMKIGIANPVAGTTMMTGDGSVIGGPSGSLRLNSTKTSTYVATRMSPKP